MSKRLSLLSFLVLMMSGAAFVFVYVDGVYAVSTERFVLDDADALGAGELTGTAVHSDGRVTIGAALDRVALPEGVSVVYSVAATKSGVFIGTGNEGRVYRVRGETVTDFAQTGQLLVSSLAVGRGGTLYAGTLPEGRIYRIAPSGQTQELVRPGGDDTEHVWALIYDARRSLLFAGTGPQGRVYAINAQGTATVWWDSAATHIMSLTLAADGSLYAGTSDDAIVARIRGRDQVEMVHDFEGNEITALAFRDGTLVVGANEFPDPPRVSAATSKARGRTSGRAPRPRPGKGRVWRIDSAGRPERLYSQDDGHITSVQILADGTVYAASGNEGRIIRINPDETTSIWIDVDERQVMRLMMAGSAPFFVTSDSAALYRVRQGRPRDALWESKVLDGRFRSRWGRLAWRGSGNLVFQTRSGNTEEPDETWSTWSSELTRTGPIRSPQARFLQIRARFDRDPNATIRAVTAYFLPQNQRATITDVRVEGPNKAATKRMRAERRGHVPEPASVYKLRWTNTNVDEDRLRYRVSYREEGQSVWRQILREDEVLTDDHYDWETESIPDGWYVVRVEASDEMDNPSTLALRSTRESEPIRIDNHAPQIEALRFAGGQINGRAVDSLGPIARLEFAIDGGLWNPAFPSDDLFDNAQEEFRIGVGSLDPGVHVISVRATDAGGNVASRELQFRTGRP